MLNNITSADLTEDDFYFFSLSENLILGTNEACLNLLNESIVTENGKQLAMDVLEFIRERLIDFHLVFNL